MRRRWQLQGFRLVVKLAGFGAAIGGPMYAFDLLKHSMDDKLAFGLVFAPVALLVFGLLTVYEEGDPSLGTRVVVGLGLLGALGVCALAGFSSYELFRGVEHPNATMLWIGNAVGLGVSAVYVQAATAYFTDRS